MRDRLHSVMPVLAASLLMLAGNGLVSTLVAVHVQVTGRAPWVAALLSSLYFAGFVIGAVRCRSIVDGVGHIRAYSAFASLCAVLVLALGFVDATPAWAVLRLATGLCSAGLFVVLESWLNSRATSSTRGTILSLYMIMVFLGLALGQLPIGTLDPTGFEPVALAAVLYAASLVPLALSPAPQPEIHTGGLMGLRRLWALSPLGVVGCLASGAMLGPFYGLAPVWVLEEPSRAVSVPAFMSVAILGGLALQWPLGRLSDRVDRRWVLVASLVLLCLACLLLASPLSTWGRMTLPGAALLGGALFVVYPLAVAHANDALQPGQLVPASGGLLMLYGVGSAASPLVAGPIMGRAGAWSLFAFIGAVALLTAGYAAWRLVHVDAVATAHKDPFVALPRTSPALASLDPRAAPPAGAGAAGDCEGPTSHSCSGPVA
jgi:MFS family permease